MLICLAAAVAAVVVAVAAAAAVVAGAVAITAAAVAIAGAVAGAADIESACNLEALLSTNPKILITLIKAKAKINSPKKM